MAEPWPGQGRWASEEALDPLTARELRAVFPSNARVRIVRQTLLGLARVHIAVAERPDV